MNPAQILAAQPWVERLGWTLLHFLWQGLCIAGVYAAARGTVARHWHPQARYLLSCAAMAGMIAAPAITWTGMRAPDTTVGAVSRTGGAPESVSTSRIAPLPPTSLPASAIASEVAAQRLLPWVVMLWFAGAAVFWIRLAGGWLVAGGMRSMLVRRAPPEWQESLRRLGAGIGLTRPVRLLVSAFATAPSVVGWLRPVVLVPVGALAGLPAAQLEALLLHELAHIRRHDYLVNILQSAVEALLFYHPAVWWVSGQMRAEREWCCDDLAVAVTGDPLTYARALTGLEACRPACSSAAMAANGGSLRHRVARILGQPRPAAAGPGLGVLAIAILLAAAAYGLFGQSDAYPAFQSVSIRRNPTDWRERLLHPMSMRRNASLLLLIRFAYATHENPMRGHSGPLPASQVIGGPPWIDSEGYDIDVKPGNNTDPQQEWRMWQSLLADKFQLRLHRETRQLPVYVMTAANHGIRLPAAKPVECISFPPGTAPRAIPGKADCGYVSGPYPGHAAGLLHIKGSRVRVADLNRELALILDRPILDRTNWSREFDLDLSFAPNEALKGFPATGRTSDTGSPDIFAALETQLGLKLEPAIAPVEVLVVDHAERPQQLAGLQ